MSDKVTKRQKAVLDCIEECIREKGYGPTVREVCQSLGLSSPSTVHVHLKALEEKGLIKRDPLKSRSIAHTYPLGDTEMPIPINTLQAYSDNYNAAWKYFGQYFDEHEVTYLNFNTQYFKAFSHDLSDYTDFDGHMNGNAAKEYSKVLANILKGEGV